MAEGHEGLSSTVMLVMLLGAVYLLFAERRAPPEADGPDWRDTDPSRPRGGGDDETSSGVPLRYRPSRGRVPDPLDFTPDLKGHVDRLRDRVGARTGNLGAVMEIEWHCRRFAMMVYRRIGRDPVQTSKLDSVRAADDLGAIRSDIVNAVHAMYASVYKERLQAEIDAASDGLMRDTAAYIRLVRRATGPVAKNLYQEGRGFPSPWNESSDPNYDVLV